jgi:proteasome lid subunit RPN8/RPN11
MSSLDIRAIDAKELKDEPFPKTKHEFRVFVSEEAFDRAVARGDSDVTREIGGVLVGELMRDAAGPYLKIESTVDALHAEEKGAELTFTHATWEHIHKEMDSSHKNKKVVGWYHTHPGFGIFLSDRDQFIHKSFFNLPFQVAFVYDPKSREHGMFVWRDNDVWRLRSYWVGSREQVWDGSRGGKEREGRDGKDRDGKDRDDKKSSDSESRDDRARDSAPDDSLSSLASLIVIGVILLLVGGFVGHWIGAASANRAIEEIEVKVANAKAEGAQLAITQLQSDLLGVMRETLGDQAVRKPVAQAITELDGAIAALEGTAAPTPPTPPTLGAGSAAGSGSAAGNAAPTGDARAQAVSGLKTVRDSLRRLSEDRNSAQAMLTALESASRRSSDLRTDLAHDVAEQRSGLGLLYAELAADAAKSGDKARASRLLSTAAHLDPSNRSRYETQLRSFDKSGHLPGDIGDTAGSAAQGGKK